MKNNSLVFNMKIIVKVLVVFFSTGAFSQSGKVVGVKDGDTIVLLENNKTTTIRLAEVDCPESGQPFGKNAKQFTSALVYQKFVDYEVISYDRYGRTIAKVFIDNKYLSEELIKNGFGWHYKKYSNSENLAELQHLARKNKKGLWVDSVPVAPWDWRH